MITVVPFGGVSRARACISLVLTHLWVGLLYFFRSAPISENIGGWAEVWGCDKVFLKMHAWLALVAFFGFILDLQQPNTQVFIAGPFGVR